jgi:hypothetical protein
VNRTEWSLVILSTVILLIADAACAAQGRPSALHCLEAPYSGAPAGFGSRDLAGTWETGYDGGVDRLIFRTDGTFKQIYEERVAYVVTLYRYETPWNEWWVEPSSDGRTRVHMKGARYYLDGVRMGELDGAHFGGSELWAGESPPPYGFYDPFAHETVHMVGELVLNVRTDSTGQLLLHHMWSSSDRGFVVFGCEQEQFRRVDTP